MLLFQWLISIDAKCRLRFNKRTKRSTAENYSLCVNQILTVNLSNVTLDRNIDQSEALAGSIGKQHTIVLMSKI